MQPHLADIGLAYGLSGGEPSGPNAGSAVRFVAIASRWPLASAARAAVPAPELVVCALVEAASGPVEVIGVHIPTIARGRLTKVETEEGLGRRLQLPAAMPRVVCGDFNAPKAELADGTVVPFASKRDERAHAAEVAVLGSAARLGLVDAFRAIHGYDAIAHSWWWKNRGRTGGYRLDHILASRDLEPHECYYRDDLREAGLSDHAPLFARFRDGRESV